jgi:hypothetical protein
MYVEYRYAVCMGLHLNVFLCRISRNSVLQAECLCSLLRQIFQTGRLEINNQQTNEPTNQQTNKPTSQQTNKPTNQQPTKQTNNPTNSQTHKQRKITTTTPPSPNRLLFLSFQNH